MDKKGGEREEKKKEENKGEKTKQRAPHAEPNTHKNEQNFDLINHILPYLVLFFGL